MTIYQHHIIHNVSILRHINIDEHIYIVPETGGVLPRQFR